MKTQSAAEIGKRHLFQRGWRAFRRPETGQE